MGLGWDEFTSSLAFVLSRLARDQYLIIERSARGIEGYEGDTANYYVQFAQGGEEGFRAEAVSNRFLSGLDRLSPDAERQMGELGWLPPDRDPKRKNAALNFYRDWPMPAPHDEIAALAVTALRQVYGASNPSDLLYRAFDKDGRPFAVPAMGITPEPVGESGSSAIIPSASMAELRPHLEVLLKQLLGVDELKQDKEGDFPIRSGDAMVFIRFIEDPPLVHLFSPLLWDIQKSERLLDAINEANLRTLFGRIVWTGREVMAVLDVPAIGISPEDLSFGLATLARSANGLDHELQASFGGRTMFGGALPPIHSPSTNDAEPTGYL